MEIKKIIEEKVNASKGELRNDIEYFERVSSRKESIKNCEDVDLSKYEKSLLLYEHNPINIDKKGFKLNQAPRGSWMDFLKPEEAKEIASLTSSDPRYQRIRANCYLRRYYSDPLNLDLQYQRNKKYRNDQKEEKKKELIKALPSIMEDRKKKMEDLRKKDNEIKRLRYHEKKTDPEFQKKDRERGKKFRDTHKNYMKIQHTLRREGLLPLSKKSLARKEEIQKTIAQYKTAAEFRIANMKDYNWINSYGLREEMLGGFPDSLKKKKYESDREDKSDKSATQLRKAQRNASKCKSIDEFARRFTSSYDFVTSMGILDEITKLIK